MADGRTIRAKVAGDADPGYLSTSKMLGQAAACLAALDKPEKPAISGRPPHVLAIVL